MGERIDRTIYESEHPDVLAAWDRWCREKAAFGPKLDRIVRKLGFSTRTHAAVYVNSLGGGLRMVGVQPKGVSWKNPGPPIPDHWLVEKGRNGTYWRPRASGKAAVRKAGEEASRIMAKGRIDDIRSYLPGMPPHAGIFARCGIDTYPEPNSEHPQGLTVTWSVAPGSVDDQVDHDLWRMVPLSEWFARLEAAS